MTDFVLSVAFICQGLLWGLIGHTIGYNSGHRRGMLDAIPIDSESSGGGFEI